MTSKENKAIIACYSLVALDVFAAALDHEGITYVRIDGTVANKARTNTRLNFQDPRSSNRVLLLTSKAGGVALNLTAANILYIVAPD